tara:strand:- start:729 stop:1091 length:363 start_codon:yes stop_codon:yes gene_type:complete
MKLTNNLNEIYELLNSGNIELAFTLAESTLGLNEIELIEWLWILLAKDSDDMFDKDAGDMLNKYLRIDNTILEYYGNQCYQSNWWIWNNRSTLLFDDEDSSDIIIIEFIKYMRNGGKRIK